MGETAREVSDRQQAFAESRTRGRAVTVVNYMYQDLHGPHSWAPYAYRRFAKYGANRAFGTTRSRRPTMSDG
jgi:hypothetical protein